MQIHYDIFMYLPLPIRIVNFLQKTLPYPALMVGSAVFVILFLIYFVGGVVYAGPEIYVWNSVLEREGFAIIIPIIPAYLLLCMVVGVRRNDEVYRYLYLQINPGADDARLLERYDRGRYWPASIVLGLFITATNLNWSGLVWDYQVSGFAETMFIVTGNIVIWSSANLVLFFFLVDGYGYHDLGKKISIDLYNLDKLNGFGRASLGGFLMVMGALALSTLQSIDQEFSWFRYRNGLVIGVPASIALAMLPSWSVHRRLRRQKRRHLDDIAREIDNTSKSLASEALIRMNGLIARKAAIQSCRTWPMDFSIFSRFILYVFIPPLAWVGAALMEVLLDSYLAG